MSSIEPVPCPHIVYDPELMERLPGPVRVFVFYHEYAHLVLRHNPPTPGLSQNAMEMAADCLAGAEFARQVPSLVPGLVEFLGEHGPPEDSEHLGARAMSVMVAKCALAALEGAPYPLGDYPPP
jgi:hypothetical protein